MESWHGLASTPRQMKKDAVYLLYWLSIVSINGFFIYFVVKKKKITNEKKIKSLGNFSS